MNKELFASMREQMAPSGEARAALKEKLAAPRRKRIPVGRYAALAACAAVIVAAIPLWRVYRDHNRWQQIVNDFQNDIAVEITEPHSYVLSDDLSCWPEDAAVTENSPAGGESDEDQDMTPGELTDNLLEAGFTQADVDAYLASGWQMTWAKWWKFYHQSEETRERTLEALLDFSQAEGLAISTGETPAAVPGGAYVIDAPVQENAVAAYQNLMARFEADYGPDIYPEWYGGAYIDNSSDCLVVNVVEWEYYGPDLAALYAQIEDWAGSGCVSFRSGRHSLNYLLFLEAEVLDAMSGLSLAVGCGVNEETGQVELTLPEADEDALWKLAELDPTGAAILVIVNQRAVLTEEPAVAHTVRPGADDLPTDEDDAIAYEPQG